MYALSDLLRDRSRRKAILFYVVMLLPFFKPGCIAELDKNIIEICYATAEVIVTLGFLLDFIKKRRNFRDPFLIAVFALTALVLLSTLLNGQSIRNWLGQWAPRFAVVVISCCAMNRKPVEYISSVITLLSALCIANLITVVAFPSGMYQTPSTFIGDNFFLGHRNGAGLYILLMISSSLILDNYGTEYPCVGIRTLLLYFVGLAQTVLAFCATTLISLLVFGVGLLILKSRKLRHILNPILAVIIGLAGNISVVVFRIQLLFAPIIEGILHREVSLSSRTTIWEMTLNLISGKYLLLGRGVDGHNAIVIRETVINSAHNELLNILLQSGLLGLLSYVVFFGSVILKAIKNKNSSIIFVFAIFNITILIMGIAYVTTSVMTFLALSLFYYLNIDFKRQ